MKNSKIRLWRPGNCNSKDVGGVDKILEMTDTDIPNTSSVECTDHFTITDNGDGTFRVEKANKYEHLQSKPNRIQDSII